LHFKKQLIKFDIFSITEFDFPLKEIDQTVHSLVTQSDNTCESVFAHSTSPSVLQLSLVALRLTCCWIPRFQLEFIYQTISSVKEPYPIRRITFGFQALVLLFVSRRSVLTAGAIFKFSERGHAMMVTMMMILPTDSKIGNGHKAIWKDKKVETSKSLHVEMYFLTSPNH
jgi:hypothetical protein